MAKRLMILAACLLLVCVLGGSVAASSGEDVLVVTNLEDFLTFAENCRLDSYSYAL